MLFIIFLIGVPDCKFCNENDRIHFVSVYLVLQYWWILGFYDPDMDHKNSVRELIPGHHINKRLNKHWWINLGFCDPDTDPLHFAFSIGKSVFRLNFL